MGNARLDEREGVLAVADGDEGFSGVAGAAGAGVFCGLRGEGGEWYCRAGRAFLGEDGMGEGVTARGEEGNGGAGAEGEIASEGEALIGAGMDGAREAAGARRSAEGDGEGVHALGHGCLAGRSRGR